jgi:hypothetical protein
MMRGIAAFMLLGLSVALLPSPALAGGNVNFTYGARSLDDDSWEPIDEQDAFGLTFDFGAEGWPVNIAVGFFESSDEDTTASFPILGDVDVEGEVSEYSLGVHKVWETRSAARPFLGGGLTRVEADATLDSILGSIDDDDSSTGLYIEGGLFFRIAQVLNLGFHARLVEGTDVTVFDVDGDADYYQLGALIGFGWPGRK